MAKFHRYHLTITGVLFLIAFVLYAVGWGSGAIMLSVLGAMVEVIAWISMLGDESQKSSASRKEESRE